VNTTTNGKTTARVTARLTYENSFADTHTFPLVKEDDRWKVCGEPF
jgi:hypothetical protein